MAIILNLRPEQVDPFAYEIGSVKDQIGRLLGRNAMLSCDTSGEREEMFRNLRNISDLETTLAHLVSRQKGMSRNVASIGKKHLRLVWSK